MFEFLFKYPRSYFESGQIVLPTWGDPLLLVALLGVLAGAALISLWAWRSRLAPARLAVLGLLQLGALTIAVTMLAQPVLELEQIRPGDNRLIVLLDTSRSMAVSDDGRETRLQSVLPLLEETLSKNLGDTALDLEIRTFSGDISSWSQALEQEPVDGTSLAAELESALRASAQQAVAGVLLVSDGADNSNDFSDNALANLSGFGIPIHTFGVGSANSANESQILAVDLPSSAMPGSQLTAAVTLQASSARTAFLKTYDGDRILATQEVSFADGNQPMRVRTVLSTGEVGVRDLRFVLDPAAGETNLVNNEFRHTLTVAQDQPRVLYVEGEPRWEYKFIRRALDDSGFLHLHGLIQTSVNKTYRQGIESPDQLADGFPSTREELFAYDALIIGSQQAASLSAVQQQLIRDFVDQRGGSLLMLGGLSGLADGGWQNTSVASLLPVSLNDLPAVTFDREPARVVASPDGLRSSWLRLAEDDAMNRQKWSEIPDIADFQRVGELKPGATLLLEAETDGERYPLLTYQRYGRGKSFVLATGGTWRWQMQLAHEDLTHEIFWQSLLREMISEAPQQISFTTDASWYRDDNRIRVSAMVRDADYLPAAAADVRVRALGSNGVEQTLALQPSTSEPGAYEASFEVDSSGLVQLDMNGSLGDVELDPIRLFTRRDDGLIEYYNTALNQPLLQHIADVTGGINFNADNLDELLDTLRFSPSGVTETQWLPLWSMPFNFFLLLVLKAGEWLLRRRWGRL